MAIADVEVTPPQKNKQPTSCESCNNVDALVSIDAQGQLVLPKDVRDKAQINEGDKFAVVTCESCGQVGFIALIKVESLSDTVKDMLEPLVE
jgi:AbrB family looped-hinge helix DNA binding protein